MLFIYLFIPGRVVVGVRHCDPETGDAPPPPPLLVGGRVGQEVGLGALEVQAAAGAERKKGLDYIKSKQTTV